MIHQQISRGLKLAEETIRTVAIQMIPIRMMAETTIHFQRVFPA